MSSVGTKVNDPHSVTDEPTGLVTSDSLAAESLKSSGSFGANNPHAAASSQPSAGTTANNTDTSGATVLPPAASAAERDDQANPDNATGELGSGRGAGKAAGRGPTYNTPADERAAARRAGEDDGPGSKVYNTTTGSGANAGVAPSYVDADRLHEAEMKPKGKNLHEGGFDSDNAKNASFQSDIGDKNDPGRVAENKFAGVTGIPGNDAGQGKGTQKPVSGFGVLDEENA